MVDIKPFAAVFYNQEKIRDLSQVVCPPYDVISPQQQELYFKSSPYNFIHILLRKDIPGENKYQKAKIIFNKWLRERILIWEKKSIFYFYSQEYLWDNKKMVRLGFIGLLKLKENDSQVLGHEHTRVQPKEDRFKLLKATQANLSPIFTLFSDDKKLLSKIYRDKLSKEPPFIEVVDKEGTIHRLWRIEDSRIIKELRNYLRPKRVVIADGHHRYEVACMYMKMMEKNKNAVYKHDYKYLLTYFTDYKSEGLTIFPIHRIIKIGKVDLKEFLNELEKYFFIKEIKDKTKFFSLFNKTKTSVIGMYKEKRFWILRLKDDKILDAIACDKPKSYRSLAVVILNTLISESILKIKADDERILFVNSLSELFDLVDKEKDYVGFILKPIAIKDMLKVISSGHKMPPKSTYFYPKVLSGLLIHKFKK